jgi:hypothetical protein
VNRKFTFGKNHRLDRIITSKFDIT